MKFFDFGAFQINGKMPSHAFWASHLLHLHHIFGHHAFCYHMLFGHFILLSVFMVYIKDYLRCSYNASIQHYDSEFPKKNNFDMLCFDDHKKTRSKSSHMLRIGGVALDFKVGAITEAKIVKLKTVKLKRFQFFIIKASSLLKSGFDFRN